MCDTFVALGNSTVDGSVILAKNSDREPNEAQEIIIISAMDHPEGSQTACTYISIPQVAHTYAIMLSKPFWMWGAEMGVNEHGVAIGNEAIFTKVPYQKENGLIGMDFIRLALERSLTAWDALQTITNLLETYGQGGNCGYTHPFYYHNSFILADPHEAWVLETAGKQWVAERVKNIRSISNAATIGSTWDLASEDVVRYALDRRWCKDRASFNFARCYSDFTYTTFSDARSRQTCTTRLLHEQGQRVSVRSAMQILRSHGLNTGPAPRFDLALTGASVCMHAGAGPVRNSQSVGSLVAHLTPALQTCWVTATSAPCTSIFKPAWIDAGLPWNEPAPTGKYDPASIFWRHERLHRCVMRNYGPRAAAFTGDRDWLEDQFVQNAGKLTSDLNARRAFAQECFTAAEQAENNWLSKASAVPYSSQSFYYKSAWNKFAQQAGMD